MFKYVTFFCIIAVALAAPAPEPAPEPAPAPAPVPAGIIAAAPVIALAGPPTLTLSSQIIRAPVLATRIVSPLAINSGLLL